MRFARFDEDVLFCITKCFSSARQQLISRRDEPLFVALVIIITRFYFLSICETAVLVQNVDTNTTIGLVLYLPCNGKMRNWGA